jgi:CRISPR system Cascade subunit CasB
MTLHTGAGRSRGEALIDHLEKLAEGLAADRGSSRSRAALAALRRGLGRRPGTVAEVEPHVAPYLPETPSRRDDAYYLVASLFALHPEGGWQRAPDERGPTNLGASFRRLQAKEREQGGTGENVDKRFVALLNAHAEDLPEHLRHAISLLKAHNVPVDWRELLRGLLSWDANSRSWDADSRRVQRAWARAYWGASGAAPSEPAGADADATDTNDTPEML